ncbi:beta-ketoacyl-ACP synthase II [Maritalea porphyrae]|uniref:3-oxoacyl-[acyl-carrier-protein] synthase 2 n=1 Tax=Maritalea porphyrae TaxID=880732 RepID=A0ABQ5UU44_9HYPH|nr:beta-ketoacyl-ACP synthase II [Maritalea porphyrae]GLQ18806.1 3-oxoacyl-[acyl-carrier-protein] synthase 2 [Maritalea porphyrae]
MDFRDLKQDPIVVTGMGAVSPLGVGVQVNWDRLLGGKSGVVAHNRFDTTEFAAKIAGVVPTKEDDEFGFAADDHIAPKDIKKMDLFIQYGIAAANEALSQAGWAPATDQEKERSATIIATGVGGFPAMTAATRTIDSRGPRRLSPFVVPSFLANLAAGHISILHQLKGPIGAPVTACAASAQAIGDGMRLIMTGEADVAICGGAEACVDPVSIGGFAAARALATDFNDTPETASRPFDKKHAGFVLSEGAAVLVIERLSHAQKRGAEPLAVLSGYGTSGDAFHLTASAPDGEGGQRAMRQALRMAELAPSDISYINAHSTSTPVGDAAEIAGISAVFEGRGKDLPVTSTKSSVGHLLGAAGAIEAVYSIMALRNNIVPAGLNIEDPEPEADKFELVANKPREWDIKHVLSNGFGFGGVNASLIFSAV